MLSSSAQSGGLAIATLVTHQQRWTEAVAAAETPERPADPFLALVFENHARNHALWLEEDRARRDDQGADFVYRAKRAIDRYNQQRNDFMEKMDIFLVEALRPQPGLPCNSETPGQIIDRLSILALKAHYMGVQARREDATEAHREACTRKLATIQQQRRDLAQALEELVADVQAGRRSFRTYFQFKMYNDPSLNPELYGSKRS